MSHATPPRVRSRWPLKSPSTTNDTTHNLCGAHMTHMHCRLPKQLGTAACWVFAGYARVFGATTNLVLYRKPSARLTMCLRLHRKSKDRGIYEFHGCVMVFVAVFLDSFVSFARRRRIVMNDAATATNDGFVNRRFVASRRQQRRRRHPSTTGWPNYICTVGCWRCRRYHSRQPASQTYKHNDSIWGRWWYNITIYTKCSDDEIVVICIFSRPISFTPTDITHKLHNGFFFTSYYARNWFIIQFSAPCGMMSLDVVLIRNTQTHACGCCIEAVIHGQARVRALIESQRARIHKAWSIIIKCN